MVLCKEAMTGQEIKKCRKKMGITQKQLASILGCTQAFVSSVENNKRPVGQAHLKVLSRLFGKKIILRKNRAN